MESSSVRAKHKQFLFPNVANYYAEPLVPVKAQGINVRDAEGKKYLDFELKRERPGRGGRLAPGAVVPLDDRGGLGRGQIHALILSEPPVRIPEF